MKSKKSITSTIAYFFVFRNQSIGRTRKSSFLKSPKLNSFLATLLITLLSITSVQAGTKTWTGAISTAWHLSSNWSGGIPTSGDEAYIPGNLSRYPIISTVVLVKKIKINTSGSNASVTIAIGGSAVVSEEIVIYAGGTLNMTNGLLESDGMEVYGTFNQSSGIYLSSDDVEFDDQAVGIQTGGTMHLASSLSGSLSEVLEIQGGSVFTQSGGIINVKDLLIKENNSKFIQNENSGTSLITIRRDYAVSSNGEFKSTAGTITWTGLEAGSNKVAFDSDKNQFFNVIVNGTYDPNFAKDKNTELVVLGNWTNNNASTDLTNKDTKVTFAGTSNAQIIGGLFSTEFYDLVINNTYNSAPQLTLGNHISISNDLDLADGLLSIGIFNITMNSGSDLVDESKNSFVHTNATGVFTWKSCAKNDKKSFPVGCMSNDNGYAPVELTFNNGHVTDDYSVSVANVVSINGTRSGTLDTANNVTLTWFIDEANAGGTNLDFEFQWNDTLESKSLKKNRSKSIQLKHYTSGSWDRPSGKVGNVTGSGPYKVKIREYTGGFSPFTVGTEEIPTPGSEQYCWSTSDSRNEITKFQLTSGLPILQTISLGISNVEASSLNLAGDTLFLMDMDDLYYVALNASSPSAVKITANGIDDSGMTGALGSKNESDYDAMGVDVNGKIWAISEGSNALMVVINPVTGKIIPNYFGANIDYMPVKHPTGLSVDCMAFDPITNYLYVDLNDGSGTPGSDFLYRVNQMNGDTTRVANFNVGDIEGMGFDAIGRLLVTTGANSVPSSDANKFWLVDIQDATIHLLGPTPGSDTETCDCVIGNPINAIEISGYVYHDLNMDTTFVGSDSAATSFDVFLYEDVDLNGLYNSSIDLLVDSTSTNSNGYYYFRRSYSVSNPNYVVVADVNDLPFGYQFSTDNLEASVFTSGRQSDPNNNFGIYNHSALPVEWLSFTAEGENDNVRLNWSTASEVNNNYFDVEHSTDGQYFEKIGSVAGNGTRQSVANFNFVHYAPVKGINYYRLKQVDFDEAFDFSSIRVVEFGQKQNSLNVFPNPAKDVVTLSGYTNSLAGKTIQVKDILGAILLEIQLPRNRENTDIIVDVSMLPRGVYLIGFDNGTQSRLVINR